METAAVLRALYMQLRITGQALPTAYRAVKTIGSNNLGRVSRYAVVDGRL